jgi:hypothetical protein
MRLFSLAIVLLLSVASAQAQRYKPQKGSPDELLDRYYQMINDGELLTPEGWKKATKLFEQPSEFPVNGTIYVTTEYPLGNGPMDVNGDHAVAYQKWVDDLGSIDASFRYGPPDPKLADLDTISVFRLKLVSPSQWRIEGSLRFRACSRRAALHFLEKEREEVSNADSKVRIEKTLAILKNPRPRTHI